jgi:hypothetical protein
VTTDTKRCHWSCIGKPIGHHSPSCPRSFTPPAKRVMGECLGVIGGCRFDAGDLAWDHIPHCPSLHPFQPGDEPDTLARLERLVRMGAESGSIAHRDVHAVKVLALISQAQEEQRRALVRAKNEGLEKAAREAEASGYNILAEQVRAMKGPES